MRSQASDGCQAVGYHRGGLVWISVPRVWARPDQYLERSRQALADSDTKWRRQLGLRKFSSDSESGWSRIRLQNPVPDHDCGDQ